MAIVKYTLKNGTQVAYDSTAHWDSARKQNRPIRKYLGKVDPDTGNIIPSTGKRGRPRGSKNRTPQDGKVGVLGEISQTVTEGKQQSPPARIDEFEALKAQIQTLRLENDSLRKKIKSLQDVLAHIQEQAARARSQDF